MAWPLPLNRFVALRALTLALAFVHSFPMRRHVGELLAHPSLGEAWKGIGATIALGLYLVPPRRIAGALSWLWRRHRRALSIGGLVLVAAHLVPAFDHVPRFLAHPSFGDAWRGFGSLFAAAWFSLTVPMQARVLRVLADVAPAAQVAREVERAEP